MPPSEPNFTSSTERPTERLVPAAPVSARCLADDYWCDGMSDLVGAISSEGVELDLNAVLSRIPDADRSDAVVDAAIREIMSASPRSSRLGQSQARSELAQVLIERSPHLASRIRLAVLLDEVLEQAQPEPLRVSTENRFQRLPAEFGPVWARNEQRYLLVERLYGGRRSDAFRAIDRARSDDARSHMVVLKMLPVEDQAGAQWAISEASRLARVESTNVCRVVDAGTSEGVPYLATEFVPGSTLAQLPSLGSFPLPPERAVGLILEVCRGLSQAHNAGIRHLDIHPGNVVIANSGEAVLVDFGLGVHVSAEGSGSAAGASCGAPGFVAPEATAQRKAGSPDLVCADVYSVGGVLLWLLTGRAPNGQTLEEAESFVAGVQSAPSPAPALPPGVDALDLDQDLSHVLRRALSVDPARRYNSSAALASDLDTWRRREAIAWTNPSALHRAKLAVLRATPAKRWTVITVATLLVGLVLLLIVQQFNTLARERDAALARAAANDAARAAAAAESRSRELAQEQVRVAGALGGMLSQMLDKPQSFKGVEWIPVLVGARDITAKLGEDSLLIDRIARQRIDLIENARRLLPERGLEDASIEDAIIAAATGSWLLETNLPDWSKRAVQRLELASRVVQKLLPPSERFRRAVEYRFGVAKVIHSNGKDSAALAECDAAQGQYELLPQIIQQRLTEAKRKAAGVR